MNNSNSFLANRDLILEQFRIYLKYWKWFAISLVICLAVGFVKIRYSIPKYQAQAKIQIIPEQGAAPGVSLFQDLDIFSGTKNLVQDEIEIVGSRSNFIEVVNELGLNKTTYVLGKIRDKQLYQKSPFNISFLSADSVVSKTNLTIFLKIKSTTDFSFSESEEGVFKNYTFGDIVSTSEGDILVTPNSSYVEAYFQENMKVVILPVADVAQGYKDNLELSIPQEFSNILNLKLEDEVQEKARDIINKLIEVYNKNEILDKQEVADRTSSFINDRISDLSFTLSNVDQTAQDFKSNRGITDIGSEANINLNVGAANRQELAGVETQLSLAASMKDIVDQQENFEVLPTNLGLSDPTIAQTTQQFNQLVQERNRLLKSSNEKNPVIVNLNQRLVGLKRTLQASLNSSVNNLALQVNTLQGQQNIIRSNYVMPGSA